MSLEKALKKVLGNYIEADFNTGDMVDMVDELMKIFEQELKSRTKSMATLDSLPKKGEKKEPGEKKKLPYPTFVKLCASYGKGDINVDMYLTPVDNFRDKKSKSYSLFDDNLRELIDTQITFSKLYEEVATAVTNYPTKNPTMAISGICWGMLSEEDRLKIISMDGEESDEED